MENKKNTDVIEQNRVLRVRLDDALAALDAIVREEVDGLVVTSAQGPQIYTLRGAEKPYRVLIEEMKEGAVMLSADNNILYCNVGFAKMMKYPLEKIVGINFESMVSKPNLKAFKELLAECRGAGKKNSLTKGISLLASDLSIVPTQISINSISMDKTNETTTTFIVVTDLTQHMAEELKHYTSDLEKSRIALYESEQRWATTLASIGDAVIAIDLAGKITFMNSIAENLTGWNLNEASQKPVRNVFNIICEDTRLKVEDPVARVMKKGHVVGLANHTILIQRNGTEIPIDDSGAPIRAKDGKVNGVVLIFRDITVTKKAEQDILEQKLRAERYLDIVGNIILALDVQGKIILLNKKGYEILGYKEGELNGKDWIDTCLPTEIRAQLRKVFCDWVQRKTKTPENYENAILTKHGEKRLVSWHNSEVRDEKGKLLGTLSSGEDITERKKAEEKLEEYSANLERLVEERTKELQAKERLAAIGATAGMVGHDIRNPLQAITGDLYLAREDMKAIPESKGKQSMLESLDAIDENVNYINKIVSDLQDYTRPLKPALEKVNLKDLFFSTISVVDIPDKIQTQLTVDENFVLIADPAYLRRILTNLIVNAVQAMPDGGKLTIEAQQKEDRAIISVKDTGIGIPEKIKPNLFTPLFTTKAKGQGLGLAVVKRIVDSMNGTITFESKDGKGTAFTITLPLAPQKTVSK